MAKAKATLGGAFDDLTKEPPPGVLMHPANPVPDYVARRAGRPRRAEPTRLVGGQLAVRYSRALNLLSAETGKTNVQLLEEALDGLFVKYGAKTIDV